MFDVLPYTKHTKFDKYDFMIETYDDLQGLKPVILPKLSGEWLVAVINPSIKDAKSILEDTDIPTFFNINIYMLQNKIKSVLEEYPEYAHKNLTNFEVYKQFISTLSHPINTDAMNYAYRAANGDMSELEATLSKIDSSITTQSITLKDIQSEFSYTKHIYTTQVLKDFILRTKGRYSHYSTWLNELGMQYAYNSMYKTVKNYVHDKHEYLQGKAVKNKSIAQLDGVSLSILYTLFVNSTHYSQLESIMYEFDNRNNKAFRRYVNARLQ